MSPAGADTESGRNRGGGPDITITMALDGAAVALTVVEATSPGASEAADVGVDIALGGRTVALAAATLAIGVETGVGGGPIEPAPDAIGVVVAPLEHPRTVAAITTISRDPAPPDACRE